MGSEMCIRDRSSTEPRNELTSVATTHQRASLGPALPFLEINDVQPEPQGDVSLPLGDETVDDVELFFGEQGRKKIEDESTRAQQSCQDGLHDLTLQDAHYEMDRSSSSSQVCDESSAMPSTPRRESILRYPASAPRTLRPKSSFSITSSITPLKVRRSNTLSQG